MRVQALIIVISTFVVVTVSSQQFPLVETEDAHRDHNDTMEAENDLNDKYHGTLMGFFFKMFDASS